MAPTERTVLHVLPHPGGGGETYVDLLTGMDGYRFDRTYLTRTPDLEPVRLGRGVAQALRAAGRYDLLHVHGEVVAGLCLPRLARGQSIVTLHGLNLARRVTGLRRRIAVLNLHAIMRAANRTICVSQAEQVELVRLVGAARARRAVVIPNGVYGSGQPDESLRAAVREELGIAAEVPVAIWVGSLHERKDPLTAISAAERTDVTLLVVGDGPLRGEVERSAGPRVHVLGERDDVSRLLAAADVYLMTSHREGLSLSLLEAMAAGLTPIVTGLPENVEVIGSAGVTVPIGDPAAIARALDALVASPELASIGKAARDRVSDAFDAGEMSRAVKATYDTVMGG